MGYIYPDAIFASKHINTHSKIFVFMGTQVICFVNSALIKHLESSRKNINEVMYNVGYSVNKASRTVFEKITGLSPEQV
jgi:AraC-like DNA-binding protein